MSIHPIQERPGPFGLSSHLELYFTVCITGHHSPVSPSMYDVNARCHVLRKIGAAVLLMSSSTRVQIGDRKAELEAEIAAMKRLRGVSHVVELRGLYEDDDAVHLVMDYCPHGDLFDFLVKKRRLLEQDAARLFR